MKEFIKSTLDFQLATTPFFLLKNSKFLPSWLGAISTIIVFAMSFFICFDQIKELFKYEKPNVLSFLDENKNEPLWNLMDKNIHFRISDPSKNEIDETILTPHIIFCKNSYEFGCVEINLEKTNKRVEGSIIII